MWWDAGVIAPMSTAMSNTHHVQHTGYISEEKLPALWFPRERGHSLKMYYILNIQLGMINIMNIFCIYFHLP